MRALPSLGSMEREVHPKMPQPFYSITIPASERMQYWSLGVLPTMGMPLALLQCCGTLIGQYGGKLPSRLDSGGQAEGATASHAWRGGDRGGTTAIRCVSSSKEKFIPSCAGRCTVRSADVQTG